jgi:malate dehydrogenase (oxaloacetate-decarboxylating)(NADP+)
MEKSISSHFLLIKRHLSVASAVAKTAFEEGVARVDAYDDAAYKEHLRCLIYGCPEEE